MEVTAKLKFLRIAPRKTRLVADLVRGRKVGDALDQLSLLNKKAAGPVRKLIEAAVASAVNDYELERDNLRISEIRVDGGPPLKRWMPRARGRATPLMKHSSHVSLALAEIVDSGKTGPKKQAIEAPVKLGERPKEAEGVKVAAEDAGKKAAPEETDEKGKKIVDPRQEGRGGHAKIEGKSHAKGFVKKLFQRKSG